MRYRTQIGSFDSRTCQCL
ncbi:hypothetical protein EF405_12300 [Cyclobacteriaceae bacterium YHN15]|nr:hypothetical protein EF405_12300 [Cyclobacteriaceae bacterium YHN15]